MLLEDGDTLLLDSPAYSGSLAFLKPMKGVSLAGVANDEHGCNPEALESILKSFSSSSSSSTSLPRVFYTVPTGGNPTGTSTTLERKKR